jgi:hypothetical protein
MKALTITSLALCTSLILTGWALWPTAAPPPPPILVPLPTADREWARAIESTAQLVRHGGLTFWHKRRAREAEASTLTQWERLTPWTLWAVPSENRPSISEIIPLGHYRTLKECETARNTKETAQRQYIASLKPLGEKVAVPTHTYVCSVQSDDAT